jgi:hypothetical protein
MLPAVFEPIFQVFGGQCKGKISVEFLAILILQFCNYLFRDKEYRSDDTRFTTQNFHPSEYRQFASHFWGTKTQRGRRSSRSFVFCHPCHSSVCYSLIISTITLHQATRSCDRAGTRAVRDWHWTSNSWLWIMSRQGRGRETRNIMRWCAKLWRRRVH